MIGDYPRTIKDALRTADPAFDATLEVDDDFLPVAGAPVVLVADDGGPPVVGGAWLADRSPRRPVLRITAYAAGRTEARDTVVAAIEFVRVNRPGIARIEDIPGPLITRDRATGAWLASITAPVLVRTTA